MTAFLFSGQGAQSAGMGKELCESFPAARLVFERASDLLHRDIGKICFEGSIEELSLTANLQPALFTLSAAALELLRSEGITPAAAAGFSLGECSALYASGILSFEDALALVSRRAELMQSACEQTNGAMYAILGLEDAVVEQTCAAIDGYVVPVNYNCPGQLVIAGEESAAESASQALLAAGASKAVKLNVSGGFHSELMASAADEMLGFAKGLSYNKPAIPIYLNVTGEVMGDEVPDEYMPAYICRQMRSPVRFSSQINAMLRDGVTAFAELGAGRTLCGFVKRISRDAKSCNVDSAKSFEAAMKMLG